MQDEEPTTPSEIQITTSPDGKTVTVTAPSSGATLDKAKLQQALGNSSGYSSPITQIVFTGGTTALPADSSGLFKNLSRLTSITGMNLMDVSHITNMSNLFRYCPSLTGLDLSLWDTSNVKNMGAMFYGCKNLTNINFGNSFNTGNVTGMGSMFSGASGSPPLTSADSTPAR